MMIHLAGLSLLFYSTIPSVAFAPPSATRVYFGHDVACCVPQVFELAQGVYNARRGTLLQSTRTGHQSLAINSKISNRITGSRQNTHLNSKDDNLSDEIQSIDDELAREIEEALSLAKDVLDNQNGQMVEMNNKISGESSDRLDSADVSSEVAAEQKVGGISFNQVSIENINEANQAAPAAPAPPKEPPTPTALSFGATFQKAIIDETNRLTNLLFGIQQDLEETKSRTEENEGVAKLLRGEIERGKSEREDILREIEREFSAEKEILTNQLQEASTELKLLLTQSDQNITQTETAVNRNEEELRSRIAVFTDSIDGVSSDVMKVEFEMEKIKNSKDAKVEKAKKEGMDNLAWFERTLDKESEGIKCYNFELESKATMTEGRVKKVYDTINQIRSDRVYLQEQIKFVEKDSLEQIANLEIQLKEDGARYQSLLAKERGKIDDLIAEAKANYSALIEKEVSKRISVEKDFIIQLNLKKEEEHSVIRGIESKAKAQLDVMEKQYSAERNIIYQQQLDAVSAIRSEMLGKLSIENTKLEAIHAQMSGILQSLRDDIDQLKLEFQRELHEQQLITTQERENLLSQMEDIRAEYTDKLTTQQTVYTEKQNTYFERQNKFISESEEECRRAWMQLANLQNQLNKADSERTKWYGSLERQSKVIEGYEADRASFRTSLQLSWRLAREKIGKQTRKILRRESGKTERRKEKKQEVVDDAWG